MYILDIQLLSLVLISEKVQVMSLLTEKPEITPKNPLVNCGIHSLCHDPFVVTFNLM